MKCSNCGHWNRVRVNKIFIEQPIQSLRLRTLFQFMSLCKFLNMRNAEKLKANRKN